MQNQATHNARKFSKTLRRDMTDGERRLWQKLRLAQLGVKFRRQHPLGAYVADFVCLGAWAAEGTSAANWPQRFIFRRFLTQYLDIGMRKWQKLPSLGPIFASMSSAAQAPRPTFGDRD